MRTARGFAADGDRPCGDGGRTLRYCKLLTVPEIHRNLREGGVPITERTVTNLRERDKELQCLNLHERQDILDWLQTQVGHEVLWGIREVIRVEVLLVKSLLSGATADIARLLERSRLLFLCR